MSGPLASLGRITSASGQKPDPSSIKSTIPSPPRRYALNPTVKVEREASDRPGFQSAPAWMDALGGVVTQKQVMDYRGPLSDFSTGAPWTPLDTADEWVQRIDREKAKIIGWVAYRSGGNLDDVVDAVLAALPELMGGGSDD